MRMVSRLSVTRLPMAKNRTSRFLSPLSAMHCSPTSCRRQRPRTRTKRKTKNRPINLWLQGREPRTPRRREKTMAVSANRLELLQIADAVAREKVIDREIVLAAMADAIQKAARSRYGSESNIRADIN